jgi:hypothetical protein
MNTSHIAAFYWHQWKQSGGRHDFDHWDRFVPMGGNLEWFNRYWRECDVSY